MPLSVRVRRIVPVLVAVAAAHVGAALWAESERGGPDAAQADDDIAIPVVLVPRLPEPAPRPAPPRRGPSSARRGITAAPVALVLADGAGALKPPLPPVDADSSAAPAPEAPNADAPADQPRGPVLAQSIPYPVNTGYWQVGERWLFFGKTEFYCVDGFNILRFMAQPCNHIYHCAYGVQQAEGGRIRFAGVIRGRNERYDVTGGGDYSARRIAVSLTGAGHYKILPVAFSAAIDARFLSPQCPAGAKQILQR